MRLYNSQNDQLSEVPDNIARKILKYNHVSEKGGIWCLESEIEKYFNLEKINPTEATDVKPIPDLMLPKKPAPKAAKAVPVKKAKAQKAPKATKAAKANKGVEGMSVADLRALAVKKLDLTEAEAKTYKKDELIAALSE